MEVVGRLTIAILALSAVVLAVIRRKCRRHNPVRSDRLKHGSST
jgi:hypothetical protein